MADINVQQKDRSIWPWVLGLVLLVGVVWLLMEMLGGDEDPMAVEQTTPVTAPGVVIQTMPPVAEAEPAELTAYLAECTSVSQTTDEMALSHEYTSNCVRLLSAAVGSVVERDTVGATALAPTLDAFREAATVLQESPETSPNHSTMLRGVAVSAAELMEQVQATRQVPAPAQDEVTQARTAAEALQGDAPLLEQQEETGEFFQEAGEALRALSGQAG